MSYWNANPLGVSPQNPYNFSHEQQDRMAPYEARRMLTALAAQAAAQHEDIGEANEAARVARLLGEAMLDGSLRQQQDQRGQQLQDTWAQERQIGQQQVAQGQAMSDWRHNRQSQQQAATSAQQQLDREYELDKQTADQAYELKGMQLQNERETPMRQAWADMAAAAAASSPDFASMIDLPAMMRSVREMAGAPADPVAEALSKMQAAGQSGGPAMMGSRVGLMTQDEWKTAMEEVMSQPSRWSMQQAYERVVPLMNDQQRSQAEVLYGRMLAAKPARTAYQWLTMKPYIGAD